MQVNVGGVSLGNGRCPARGLLVARYALGGLLLGVDRYVTGSSHKLCAVVTW